MLKGSWTHLVTAKAGWMVGLRRRVEQKAAMMGALIHLAPSRAGLMAELRLRAE